MTGMQLVRQLRAEQTEAGRLREIAKTNRRIIWIVLLATALGLMGVVLQLESLARAKHQPGFDQVGLTRLIERISK